MRFSSFTLEGYKIFELRVLVQQISENERITMIDPPNLIYGDPTTKRHLIDRAIREEKS